MNIRDIKPSTLKRLATECDKEFEDWFKLCEGLKFGTQELQEPKDIWRTAFSKGASAVLRRVDELKDV
jgi:hypothetical protein